MSDFASFKSAFKGDLVTPTDPDYATAIARWAKNAERKAQVVAFVKDAEDVALAIKYAKANKLQIAVRGGGHSTSGTSSSEGLVIDLHRHLRSVVVDDVGKAHPDLKSLDASLKIATVGGGAIWQDVDEAAIKEGYATVGGTVNHTGVGGLSLGGGYGHLSGLYGLTVDNIVKVEIVTGNAEITTASAEINPDLFFGIRGGGSNFGVVTKFVYKVYKQSPTIFAGQLVYPPPLLTQVVDAIKEYIGPKQPPNSSALMVIAPTPHGPIVAVVVTYNGPEEEARKTFAPLLKLNPIVDTTAMIPYEKINALVNQGNEHGSCIYLTGTVHKGYNQKIYQNVLQRTIELHQKHPDFTPVTLFEFIPLDKVMETPNESMAFPRNPNPNIVTIARWTEHTAANAELGRTIACDLRETASADFDGLSDYEKCEYANNFQESAHKAGRSKYAKDLFGAKYAKLQEVKRKHDPEQVFNKFVPIDI